MSESLRDQLLKSGLAKVLKPEPRPAPSQPQRRPPGQVQRQPPPRQPSQRPPSQRQPRSAPSHGAGTPQERSEIDLAKAYALREKIEREAREREHREAEQRGRERKERKQKLAALLNGNGLNDAAADIPRHFPHTNKIRRIYVTADQLPRLNAGEFAVVQFSGRYLLVTREIALAAQAIEPDALVLLSDDQAADDDGIPADLIW